MAEAVSIFSLPPELLVLITKYLGKGYRLQYIASCLYFIPSSRALRLPEIQVFNSY